MGTSSINPNMLAVGALYGSTRRAAGPLARSGPGARRQKQHRWYGVPGVRRGTTQLERDDFSSNRHPALAFCLSKIFSENRFPLFRIML